MPGVLILAAGRRARVAVERRPGAVDHPRSGGAGRPRRARWRSPSRSPLFPRSARQAKFGVIIVKSGAAFERFGGIRHVAVDKTGTLTRNEPGVPASSPPARPENEVLAWAASLEGHSTHPLAAAITKAVPDARPRTTSPRQAGRGITGTLGSARLAVGSPAGWMPDHWPTRCGRWSPRG